MKALLVWPKFDSFTFWNFEKVCDLAGVKYMTPPLGLLTVAALLPKDWELRVVDENVHPLAPGDIRWADIVLVSSKIVHRGRALEVIREAKAAGKRTAVGGPDPSMSPDPYLAAGVDFLCAGEGEILVPRLLEALARGDAKGDLRTRELPEMTDSPVPRFDLIDHRDYLYVGMQYSRGCPYHCEFCNVIDLFQNRYRTKTLEQVLAEFELLYSLGYRGQLDFFDDNLVGNMKRAKPFLEGIAKWLEEHRYPFQLSTSVTLNVAKDPELLDLLRRARFKYFLVGIETPDEAALARAQKPHNTGFSIAEAADEIYTRAGATIHSGFLLGLDGEARDIRDRVIRCIEEAKIPWVMAGMVYPLPGTQLSKRLDREGRLFPNARYELPQGVRDQISAGLQFKPERPALDVLDDLVAVMKHSFDAEKYFRRCSAVALRLNTIPNMVPSWRIFFRNLRTVVRLSWLMTGGDDTRRPYWRELLRVVFGNPRGVEAFVTLAVLFAHFRTMVPYAYEQLAKQRKTIETLGEEAWLEQNLREPADAPASGPRPPTEAPAPTRLPLASPLAG